MAGPTVSYILLEHLERLVKVLNQTADAYHVSMLSYWLEMRDILGEPPQEPGSSSSRNGFADAYPRLKQAFDAIELAIPRIPNADGNPADPPHLPANSVHAGQTESITAAPNGVAAESDDPGPSKPGPGRLDYKLKGREPEDTKEGGRIQESGTSNQHEGAGD
ncbi:hypothetical protein FRC00_006316 [Tulasnella sp. 408]|nr:hypothetical protein FRC00_006316 [Tulasnella sp. 408]